MIAHFVYVNRDSPIHRLDPGAKFVFLLCYIFSIVLFLDLRMLLLFVLIGALYYRLTGLRWAETRNAWRFALTLALIFVGLSALIWGGGLDETHLIWSGPLGFTLTWEKIYYAIAVVLRIVGITLVSIPLTFTTRPADYGVGFKSIGLPDKFAAALDLSLRLVPTFATDIGETLDAQKARGYELENLRGGPIAWLRRTVPLVIPVTINAIAGGEDIINAMDLRAFGTGPRTWTRKRVRTNFDRFIIAFGLLLLIASLAWRISGHGEFTLFWIPS